MGLDIGGTNLRSGYVDAKGGVSHFEMVGSQVIRGEAAPKKLAEYILGVIRETGVTPAAVAAGFPSTLDKKRKRLLSTPNIQGLDNVDMADMLEKVLQLPVYIERDVNLLFTYDCFSMGLSAPVILGFYIGTGFGNAIAIGGEILTGKNGAAAELGHIPMLGMDGQCPCGNAGCAEIYASGKRLREIRDTVFPQTPMEEIFIRHLGHEAIDAFLECLSIPVATEITILDPDYVILGGGVLQTPGFPKADFERLIRRHTRKPFPEANLRLVYAKEAQENGVIGAGLCALEAMKKENQK